MPAKNIIDSILEKNKPQKRVKLTFTVSKETDDSIDNFIKNMALEKAAISKEVLLEEWTDRLIDNLHRIRPQYKKTKTKIAENAKQGEQNENSQTNSSDMQKTSPSFLPSETSPKVEAAVLPYMDDVFRQTESESNGS